jgi:LemA protein
MNNLFKGKIIWIAVILLLGVYGCSSYNSMATAEQTVKKQWGQVENAYQSRMDKTKNLLAIVQKAANFEKGTLTEVIEARAKASSVQLSTNDLTPENIQKFQAAQDQFGQSLGRLMVTVERYPELKSVDAFRDFQTQYEGIENRISTERKRYNDEVETFNKKIVTFPKNMMAKMFGYKEFGYFKAAAGSENAPDISNM